MAIESTSMNLAAQPPAGPEGKGPINQLPLDMIREIFTKLSIPEVCKASGVCKKWQEEVGKLSDEANDPTLRIFGPEKWEKLGYNINGTVPPLPRNLDLFIKWLRNSLRGKNEAPTCSVIYMPEGLTLKKMKELVEEKGTGFGYLYDPVLSEFGEKGVEESGWIVITNDIIEGSRGKTYDLQKGLVAEKTGAKCRLPALLEVLACCLMNYVESNKTEYLFGQEPWTYTRCQEQMNGWPLNVGGFASGGLSVSGDSFVLGDYGVAACRKF